MNPYYDDGTCTIYHGDCREILPELDLGRSVGTVLTSPPYNLAGARGTSFSKLAEGYADNPDDMPESEYVQQQRDILHMLWQTLSPTGAIYWNHKPRVSGGRIWLPFHMNPGLPLRQIITWDRCGGFNRVFQYYVPGYEWILVFAKHGFRITTRNVGDVWRIPPGSGSEHPAPFPLKLAAQVMATTDPDAGLVMDPCGEEAQSRDLYRCPLIGRRERGSTPLTRPHSTGGEEAQSRDLYRCPLIGRRERGSTLLTRPHSTGSRLDPLSYPAPSDGSCSWSEEISPGSPRRFARQKLRKALALRGESLLQNQIVVPDPEVGFPASLSLCRLVERLEIKG